MASHWIDSEPLSPPSMREASRRRAAAWGRAQSVVSQTLANMEGQLALQLFDRSGRIPVLTDAGRALLAEARAVAGNVDAFKARARGPAGGLEAELSVVIDVMLPTRILTQAVADFSLRFPDVPLRLNVEALGAVLQPLLDGTCAFGIVGTLPDVPGSVVREYLMEVQIVPVAAPSHPLGRHRGPLTINDLSGHVQIVLTDRSNLSEGAEFGVVSAKPWRLADLGAKHAFLKAGMGWGACRCTLSRPILTLARWSSSMSSKCRKEACG